MRKVLEGSKIVRGKKNRRNIRKQVVRNPTTAAQTIRRRILLTGGSGALSTTAPAALGAGFAAGGGAFAGAEGGGGGAAPATESWRSMALGIALDWPDYPLCIPPSIGICDQV